MNLLSSSLLNHMILTAFEIASNLEVYGWEGMFKKYINWESMN